MRTRKRYKKPRNFFFHLSFLVYVIFITYYHFSLLIRFIYSTNDFEIRHRPSLYRRTTTRQGPLAKKKKSLKRLIILTVFVSQNSRGTDDFFYHRTNNTFSLFVRVNLRKKKVKKKLENLTLLKIL